MSISEGTCKCRRKFVVVQRVKGSLLTALKLLDGGVKLLDGLAKRTNHNCGGVRVEGSGRSDKGLTLLREMLRYCVTRKV